MRQRPRLDGNQQEMVRALRARGCSVQSLAGVGAGVPDLLVGRGGVNVLVEVKDPARPPSKRRLTAAEQAWHDAWRGQSVVAETVDDVLRALSESRPEKIFSDRADHPLTGV